jgi:hypothetical protein
MDRFGRKKIIAAKAILTLVLLIPMIPYGLMAGD